MGCLYSRAAGNDQQPAAPQSSDPRKRLAELEKACTERLRTIQHLLEDSAHARSQAQWLRELIQAYTADLHECQKAFDGYSRYDAPEMEVRVGDRWHLAEKLQGVSAKQKEHLQAALNGIVSRAKVEISFCEQELAWCSAQLRDLPKLANQPKGAADLAEVQAKAFSVEETYLKTLQRTLAECQAKLQEVVE